MVVQEALEDGAVGADTEQRERHEALLWEKISEYADKVCECKDELALDEAREMWRMYSAGFSNSSEPRTCAWTEPKVCA